MKSYVENEEWICCDACSIWYHRNCVSLNDDEWAYQQNEEAVYICPMCVLTFIPNIHLAFAVSDKNYHMINHTILTD